MDDSSNGCTVGFSGVLTIVFIVLKLTGTIDWSWWWVLSPIWITFVITAVILILFFTTALVVDKYGDKF